MLDKSCQFLSSEQPSEPKSLDVAFIIARVEKKKTLGKLAAVHLIRALVTVEICVLCGP